jgi:hypothetical protein
MGGAFQHFPFGAFYIGFNEIDPLQLVFFNKFINGSNRYSLIRLVAK